MAAWYLSSVGHTAVAQFAISTAYTIGQIVRQLAAPAVGSERCFRCTTAGTSAGTEPAWNLGKAATTTSGTAIFTEVTGNSTYNWSAPFARMQSISSSWAVSGDTIYVAHNHAETQAASMTISLASFGVPVIILCVNSAGSVPPVAADLRTTATITTTGNFSISLGGQFSMYGITFNNASGGTNNQILTFGSGQFQRFEACALKSLATGSFAGITTASDSRVELENTSMFLASGGSQGVGLARGWFVWRNSVALTGVASSAIITLLGVSAANVLIDSVDFSAANIIRPVSGHALNNVVLINCKLPSSGLSAQGNATGMGGTCDFIATDPALPYRVDRYAYAGASETSATVYRTGGAANNAVNNSRRVTMAATVPSYATPFESIPVARWNALTGPAQTVTVEALLVAASGTTADLWIDAQYFGDSGSPLGSVTKGRSNELFASAALTGSTEAWGAGCTARGNSTVYLIGATYKASSNAGRVFYCTTAGASAAAEPAAVAAAVDGGSFTDGTAVFRCCLRVKLQVSITPQKAGPVRVVVKCAAASLIWFYDPTIVLT